MGNRIVDVTYESLKEEEKISCLSITKVSVLKISKLIRLYLFKPYIVIVIIL